MKKTKKSILRSVRMRNIDLPYSMGATQTYLYPLYYKLVDLCSNVYNDGLLKYEKKDDYECSNLLQEYRKFFCQRGYGLYNNIIESDKNNTCFTLQLVDFIKQNNNKGKDLSGKDLSGGKDFSYANFIEANLTNANLSNSIFFNAQLIKANLKGATLTGAKFQSALLLDADFTGAIGADFEGAIFSNTTCPNGTVTPKDIVITTGCQ
jgi:uncharacterized protein YjbI with pentapeptide repeats